MYIGLHMLIDWSIAQLQKDWDSPVYIFFRAIPSIEYVHGWKAHVI